MKTSRPSCLNAAFIALLCAAALLSSVFRAQAQANANPPNFMTYQGYLVDANGVALGANAPKNYDVIFRIYGATTGGNTLWAEQQTVTVDKGYFSVLLGEGSNIGEPRPVLNTIFTTATASDRWVSMTVKGIGPGGADANILPRLRLLTSPYSYLAQKAITASIVDGSALTSGTVADARLSANVALRAGGNNFTGNQVFGNADLFMDNQRILAAKNVSGGYENVFWPRWSDNVTYLNYGNGGFNIRNNGSTSRMFITDAGNVGIGTTAPGFPLNFPNTTGDKISLWGNSGDHYGFGIQGNLLQIHGATAADDIAFGYGTSAAMTERMRIKGNGNVGIGTSAPNSRLHISGGNLQISGGNLQINGGTIYMDNEQYLYAKNAAGTYEGFLVPRWSDNVMYLNYGTGGFHIRNSPGASVMYMQPNGNVGIGTTSPTAKLHLEGPSVGIHLQDGGDMWSMYNESGTDSLVFLRTGGGWFAIRSNGGTASSSDVRLKKDINEMEDVLVRVLKLRPVSFQLKSETNNAPRQLGFIAQEVEPLFPELVSEHGGYKGVDYANMAPVAIGAIKGLNQIVRESQAALDECTAKVQRLEREVASLKKLVALQAQSQDGLSAKIEERGQRLAAIERLLRDKFPAEHAGLKDSSVSGN